jgi:iron(III) transport system permease protein
MNSRWRQRFSESSASLPLVLGVIAFLGAFLLWPLAYVFVNAFRDKGGLTLDYIKPLFQNPATLQAMGNSFLIAVLVTAACTAVALPLAWLFARRDFAGKSWFGGALLLPMILPPFVGAVGMKIMFARAGALSTLAMKLGLADGPVDWFGAFPLLGIVLLEMLHLFPILYLNLVASLANIDPSLEEAAANLGASPGRVFRRVTLPLAAPGLFGGMALIFVWSFTELGTPLVFGYRRVLPVMIYNGIAEVGTNPAAYAQVVFVLVIAALGFWVGKRLTRRSRNVATLGRLSVGRKETRLGAGGTLLAWAGVGGLLLVAVLPHLSVLMLSVSRRWFLTVVPEGWTLEFFNRALNDDLTRGALVNSLGLSLAATALDVLLGFSIAWLCVRRKTFGSDWLDTFAMLPLAVPGLVIAFGYLGAFGSTFKDTLLDPRFNPLILLAAGYAIRRLPYMVRAAHAGLEQVSRTYEEAAANLGASPWRVVRRITLPLISANLLAGGILCFSFSMLEVSDSLILAQVDTFYPLTKAIYTLMEGLNSGINVAAALGAWAMIMLGAALLWASCILGKRVGQMFRAG